jgi:glucose-specific phosphotransferase system IIA component
MFDFIKRKIQPVSKMLKTDPVLYSPVAGEFVPLNQVSDPVFANRTMGDGFAIQPVGTRLASPVSGKVTMLTSTKHAIGFETANGIEVLLHLGLDTVNMGGSPFDISIKVGDVLDGGDELGTMNIHSIEQAGYEATTMVIITNMDRVAKLTITEGNYVEGISLGEVIAK